ncbi:MAG TPA: RagB/SusD family nutrient uptake outer membrane protein [Chitinophagaceae bacterium]|nr:RagB/SusD family nutrient uptake outer membrane protein [Chitinophagaceae bacterium]
MKRLLPILFLTLLFASCKKFLDVQPESDSSLEEMFNTAEGFEEALNGIYLRASQGDLYGGELTFGFPDVLSQNYTISFADAWAYRQAAQYNYKDPAFIGRKDAAWKGLYHAISSANLILDNIESRKQLLAADRYALIKGEALALRAYFHFDLLRLFAPSFRNNPAAKAIPYVTTFSNKVTPVSTVSEVLTKVREDLAAAKELLRPVDPIRTTAYVVGYPTDTDPKELAAPQVFLQQRRHRLNYFAVCGTLARASLYAEQYADALANAKEVIDANKFPWTKDVDFLTPDATRKDRILYPELLFGWFIPNMRESLQSRFGSGVTGLYIEENAGNALFELGTVGAEDLRYKGWVRLAVDVTGGRLELQKYLRDDKANRHPLVAPALRLSEMYYIAAEASFDTNPQGALAYFNAVRFHRGIGTELNTTVKETFLNELVKESRKEWYGEGQIFYTYKRLHRSLTGPTGVIYPASNTLFVLPLPDDEIEFGNR